MKLALTAVFLACLALAPWALKDQCISIGMNCLSSCCTGVGGSMDGQSCSYPPSEQTQFYSCANDCRVTILNCEAPGSVCTSQFISCGTSCTGTVAQKQACIDECMGSGVSCAESAGASTGDGGSCCGSALILLFAGFGGLAFARRL